MIIIPAIINGKTGIPIAEGIVPNKIAINPAVRA